MESNEGLKSFLALLSRSHLTGLTCREVYCCCKAYFATLPPYSEFEREFLKQFTNSAVQFPMPVRFRCGLRNPTATLCYLNVNLILLWKLRVLHDGLSDRSFWHSSLLQLFAALDTQPTGGVLADEVIRQLKDMRCWQDGQQDALEMLSVLQEHLQPLRNLFVFEETERVFYNNVLISETQDVRKELVLNIAGGRNIQQLVDDYFTAKDELNYRVQAGLVATAKSTRDIQRHPTLLNIVLHRFADNGTKLQTNITIDTEISVAGSQYVLFAVVLHSGSRSKGHYKLLVNEDLKMNWYLYNDAEVSQVNREEALLAARGGEECAYMLFYVLSGLATMLVQTPKVRSRCRRRIEISDVSSFEEESEEPPTKKQRQESIDSYSASSEQETENFDTFSDDDACDAAELLVHLGEDVSTPTNTVASLLLEEESIALIESTFKINVPNFICCHKYRMSTSATEWLIDWREAKNGATKTNWVPESQCSNNVRKLLTKSKQIPNFAEQQGWTSTRPEDFLPKAFNPKLCGPHNSEHKILNILECFELFFPKDLQTDIVAEINRYAKLSAATRQQERKQWRVDKVTKLRRWAEEKEKEYPDLAHNKSWKDNCAGLEKYFDSDWEPSAKRLAREEKARKNWRDISLQDLRTFLGVMLIIRCVHGRRIQDYFKEKNPKYGNEWVSTKMSRQRFFQIWCSLHYDIDTLVAKVQPKFKEHWIPYQHVTYDETILPFLGRFYALQHIPTKPHPNGVLLYLLSDSKYFIWEIDFYLGLCLPPKFQLLDVAKKLLKIQKHYIITTDSKWGSEELARLLDKNDLYFLLSCKKNSPSYLFDEMQKTIPTIGQSCSLYSKGDNQPIAATVFHDRNAYTNLISNFVSDKQSWATLCPNVKPPVQSLQSSQWQTKSKPLAAQQYTFSKGYVDEAARQLHTYDWPHKTGKWTNVVFNNVFMICVWNAYVYYKATHKKDKFTKDFRCFIEQLGDDLAAVSCRSPKRPSKLSRARSSDNSIVTKVRTRISIGPANLHYLVPIKSTVLKQRHTRCSKCKQTTSVMCLGCSLQPMKVVALCNSCGAKHQKKLNVQPLF